MKIEKLPPNVLNLKFGILSKEIVVTKCVSGFLVIVQNPQNFPGRTRKRRGNGANHHLQTNY